MRFFICFKKKKSEHRYKSQFPKGNCFHFLSINSIFKLFLEFQTSIFCISSSVTSFDQIAQRQLQAIESATAEWASNNRFGKYSIKSSINFLESFVPFFQACFNNLNHIYHKSCILVAKYFEDVAKSLERPYPNSWQFLNVELNNVWFLNFAMSVYLIANRWFWCRLLVPTLYL